MVGQVILVRGEEQGSLLPLTYLKSVAELRVGILTQLEAWGLALPGVPVGYVDVDGNLSGTLVESESVLCIAAALLASPEAVSAVRSLSVGESLVADGGRPLAWHAPFSGGAAEWMACSVNTKPLSWPVGDEVPCIRRPYDLFRWVGKAIEWDFTRLTAGRTSEPLSASVGVLGGGGIFLEQGVRAEFCTFNSTEGPIYIGRGAEVQEGAHIRGPFALGEGSMIKMGAKIYGATMVGPHCKVGGEVSNSSFQEYSNKAHDGFVGNAVIGSWCNLGADTNCSNLKNDYGLVRVWNVSEGCFSQTDLQFCGLIMGDHSKSGINTMFNTGSVVGPFCNIFGDGFPRAWIPAFSRGGAGGLSEHPLEKALVTARIVMNRRGVSLSEAMEARIRTLFASTVSDRPYRS